MMFEKRLVSVAIFTMMVVFSLYSQEKEREKRGDGWLRTREILKCAPRLVDHRELVDDDFRHWYFSTNPREVDDAYFSVEPVTYFEDGMRFCEAGIPVAGVSDSYFRGTFETVYELPGEGVYEISLESNALIFNNECRLISAQTTIAMIEASHRLQIIADSLREAHGATASFSKENSAYSWELEFDNTGNWQCDLKTDQFELHDEEIPSGISTIYFSRKIRGPGVIRLRESVLFRIHSFSSYKFEPIFQAKCLFSLQPLSVTTRLLPCED